MSKVTAGQIITEARDALNDPNATRWTNAKLFRYIFAGENLIAGGHPEMQLSDDDPKVTFPAPALCTATTDYTTISIENATVLVHYVCHRCFGEDSDDSGSMKQSLYHLQLYKDAIGDVAVGR